MKHRLDKIIIKTKRQVLSEIVGDNESIFKGEGYDFVELREYQHGEDIKNIDWVISAKFQKPYVKLFRETKELNIVTVSLLDGNCYFGDSCEKKLDTISLSNGILSLSACKQNDLLTSYIFSDEKLLIQKPTKKIHSVQKVIKSILDYEPYGKKLDYESLSKTLLKEIKRKSIIFLVGDFFGDIDLKYLAKKHEVVAIIVRNREEENPSLWTGENFIDPITNEKVENTITQTMSKKYISRVHENDHILYEHFRKNGIKSVKVYTDEEPITKLKTL